jgi:hypothetical protein
VSLLYPDVFLVSVGFIVVHYGRVYHQGSLLDDVARGAWKQFFGLKILKFFGADPGYSTGSRTFFTRDPAALRIRIRDPVPF